MYSEEQIQKMLYMEKVNIEKAEIVTERMQLQMLLKFAILPFPVGKESEELRKPLDKINFLDFFLNIDYSNSCLPIETPSLEKYMTMEKYKKIVAKIIDKLQCKEEVILHDIFVELNYQNLGSAVYLNGK